MKQARLFQYVLTLGLLSPACASEETVEMWPAAPVQLHEGAGSAAASSPVTPTRKERELPEIYLQALESPHFSSLGPILGEQVQFAFGARNTHGRERVLSGHEAAFGAFDQRVFVASRIWLTDSTHPTDSQAIEWTMTGVHARDFLGVAATQKPVVIKGLTLIWTNDDGIVSDLHVYFDEDVVRAQLGGTPPELRSLPVPKVDPAARTELERSGAPEEAANLATLRAMLQALEDNKEDDFLSTMTEDVEVVTVDRAEPLRGKAALRDYFKTMRRSVHLLDTIVRNAWGVSSFAVMEYGITGLQVAPLPRLVFQADHPLHTQFVDVAEFRDGKIARVFRYADPAAFASL